MKNMKSNPGLKLPKMCPPDIKRALQDLHTDLQAEYAGQAPTMLLYGSYARGEAENSSDVDIVLLYPKKVQPGHEINRLGAILAELNLRYQVLISILPINAEIYQQSPDVFWKNVRREGLYLDGN